MSFKTDFESNTKGEIKRDGIFINEGAISSALLHYGAEAFDGWKKSDLVLRIEVSEDGLKWARKLTFMGDYKWDDDGNVKSEHSAFKVMGIFRDLSNAGYIDGYGADKQGRITFNGEAIDAAAEAYNLKDFIGTPVLTLSYKASRKDGGEGWNTYRALGINSGEEDASVVEKRLRASFLREFKAGYVKDYIGGSAGNTTRQVDNDEPAADDLPF